MLAEFFTTEALDIEVVEYKYKINTENLDFTKFSDSSSAQFYYFPLNKLYKLCTKYVKTVCNIIPTSRHTFASTSLPQV